MFGVVRDENRGCDEVESEPRREEERAKQGRVFLAERRSKPDQFTLETYEPASLRTTRCRGLCELLCARA